MKIQDKHYYHGAAITQIVEHHSFTALNKADEKYGHYLVNQNIRLLTKHSAGKSSPWAFTFQESDIKVLQNDIKSGNHVFLCLVCALDTVCVLNAQEIENLLDINAVSGAQWIKVSYKESSSMRVLGTFGKLKTTVPHKAFPDKIFGQ